MRQAPAQQHDAALPTPSQQPNPAPLALPAGAGVLPIALPHRPLQHALDALAQAQLEQIGLAAAVGLAHHRLAAPVAVAAQQGRRTGWSQAVEQRPQPRRGMFGGVRPAAGNLHFQYQAQLGHQVTVVDVRRPATLARVVTHLGRLLMAVQRLDRGVDIQNPGLAQQRPHAVLQLLAQPPDPARLVNLAQRPPYRVLADHFLHPQQRRVDGIGAQRRDVRVPPVPGQHRQQHRAEHLALARCVRARQPQRTARHPAVKQTTLLQVLDEKRQLAHRRHRRRRLPLQVNPAGKRLRRHRFVLGQLYCRLFTRRVNRRNPCFARHTPLFPPKSSPGQLLNSRI